MEKGHASSVNEMLEFAYNERINIGKKLLRKLRIRNEQITLASKRLKTGKIDPRRIYAANFEDDLFLQSDLYSLILPVV